MSVAAEKQYFSVGVLSLLISGLFFSMTSDSFLSSTEFR